jgi:chromatin segregation and condensation protein Rec8/ScpA/Scc1 (kleisin family)
MAFLHEHDDDDEPGREYNDELLADISADERMADAPQDKDEEHIRIRRIKNTKRAKHRQNAEARARNPPHRINLDGAFAAADDRQYNTPIGNIAEAALLIQRLPKTRRPRDCCN